MAMPSNGLTTVITQIILDTGKNHHGNSFQWFDTCHDTNNLRHIGKNHHGNVFQWFDTCRDTILDTGKNHHGNTFQGFDTCRDTILDTGKNSGSLCLV